MSNKFITSLRGKIKMFITGIVITILGFLSAVYSSLASFSPLRHVLPFRWFLISRFYRNALKGVAKLEETKLFQNSNSISMSSISEDRGILTPFDNGFNELKIALKQEKIIETTINKIELVKMTTPSFDSENNRQSQKTKLSLEFFQNDNFVKSWAFESTQTLNDIVEKSIQFRFAILNIFLALIISIVGAGLIIASRK